MSRLDAKKQYVLETWLNNPSLTFTAIAEKAGISRKTFERYREDEEFMAEYDRLCRIWYKSLKATALNTMHRLAEEGNYNAAKYLLDNDFAPTQKVDVTASDIKINIGGNDDE